jgi:cytochrome c-type biogenesis protein CcmH
VRSARNRLTAWGIAAALAVSALSCAPEPPTTQSAVESQLTCQCGCGLTVQSCNHLQCSFAIPVREDIAKSLANDETGEDIIARYAEEYGEKVLSAPVREGFNLLAWYGPYIALFGAGIIVILVIRRWTPERIAEAEDASSGSTGKASDSELSGTDRDRLQNELEDYDP